jgi:hypothetical protein
MAIIISLGVVHTVCGVAMVVGEIHTLLVTVDIMDKVGVITMVFIPVR